MDGRRPHERDAKKLRDRADVGTDGPRAEG
jgi:hypothetical protein